MSETVAVIIPVFNGEPWIARTLDSVLAQSHRPADIVVVDDGSEDRSRAIASSYPGVTVTKNPGSGANSARRFGQRSTQSSLVAFLDQDDVWHPDHLGLLVDALDRTPGAPAAAAEVTYIGPGEAPSFPAPSPGLTLLDPWERFPFSVISTPSSVLLRRGALRSVGGWPARLVGVADYYTWLRLSARAPLVKRASVTVGYRQHGGSYSRRLRARSGARYLGALAEAANETLDHLPVRTKKETETLRDRARLLEGLVRLLDATTAARGLSVTLAAARLERQLTTAPEWLVRAAGDHLAWALQPVGESDPAGRGAVLDALYGQWPGAETRLGPAVRIAVERGWSWRVFGRYLAQRPARRQAWALLWRIARDRMGRLAPGHR